MHTQDEQQLDGTNIVLIGKIIGIYGIKGWVKVLSYTRPMENIRHYKHWLLGADQTQQTVIDCKQQGKAIIAKLDAVDDREQAGLFKDLDIYIRRSQLPELAENEYYWHDLIGLTVVDMQQQKLGVITEILETGANDVLVVTGDKRRLIPWVMDLYIKDINLSESQMTVDWQDEED